MRGIYSLLIPLFLLTCLIAACGNDDNNTVEGINGTFTAMLHNPDGSTYNFVADSIAVAYLVPTNDSLLLMGVDKAKHSVFITIGTNNLNEGQTITANPSNIFLSSYLNYEQIPYSAYLGSGGDYGTPDILSIGNLDAADKQIAGSFELTCYPFFITGLEYNDDLAVQISNGQFDLTYFNSQEEAAAYFDLNNEPAPTTHSAVTCNISSENGTIVRNNFELEVDSTLAALLPTSPQNLFTLTFPIGEGYRLGLTFTAALGSHTVQLDKSENGFSIVSTTGNPNAYNYFGSDGTINVTAWDQNTKTVVGDFTVSGIGAIPTDPESGDMFEANGTFTVQYP